MLIVVTSDKAIVDWSRDSDSGSGNWGVVNVLTPGPQAKATNQLNKLLKKVGKNEPLCIVSHGNDAEIGDENPSQANAWTWTSDDMGNNVGNNLPSDYQAPILLATCCESITDFTANMALALERIRRLNKVWIYGYNKGVPIRHPFPAPDKLDKSVELTGKQVKF
jgi:hypothetical protein